MHVWNVPPLPIALPRVHSAGPKINAKLVWQMRTAPTGFSATAVTDVPMVFACTRVTPVSGRAAIAWRNCRRAVIASKTKTAAMHLFVMALKRVIRVDVWQVSRSAPQRPFRFVSSPVVVVCAAPRTNIAMWNNLIAVTTNASPVLEMKTVPQGSVWTINA